MSTVLTAYYTGYIGQSRLAFVSLSLYATAVNTGLLEVWMQITVALNWRHLLAPKELTEKRVI